MSSEDVIAVHMLQKQMCAKILRECGDVRDARDGSLAVFW